ASPSGNNRDRRGSDTGRLRRDPCPAKSDRDPASAARRVADAVCGNTAQKIIRRRKRHWNSGRFWRFRRDGSSPVESIPRGSSDRLFPLRDCVTEFRYSHPPPAMLHFEAAILAQWDYPAPTLQKL